MKIIKNLNLNMFEFNYSLADIESPLYFVKILKFF